MSIHSALKKFYMQVHPDLFIDTPELQKVNDDNFKKFTQYIDKYKSGSLTREFYDVEFYTKQGDNEPKLIKARLELPSSRSTIDSLEYTFKNSLSKLFIQCNITEDFDVSGFGATSLELRAAGKNETSIINMIISASTKLKSKKTSPELAKAKDELISGNKKIQEQLKENYNLTFTLEVPATIFHTAISKYSDIRSWLKKIEYVIDELEKSGHKLDYLKNRKISFAFKKMGVYEPKGTIYLEINESTSAWFDFLSRLSEEYETNLKSKMEKVKELEMTISSMLNLNTITSNYKIHLENIDEYIEKLVEIKNSIQTKPSDWKFPGPFKSINIHFVANMSGTNKEDPKTKSLHLPFNRKVEDTLNVIKQVTPQVVISSKNYENALANVKQFYNLPSVTVSHKLDDSPEKYYDSLTRLIDGRHHLQHYLYNSNLNLCISDQYSFNEEAKILFIESKFFL